MLTDDLFYEQTMKNTVRRRKKAKDKISAVEGSEALAADDFESKHFFFVFVYRPLLQIYAHCVKSKNA